ncbi:hypothetical protein COO60DRAFT_1535616, partial [Scenedesmus sp. NREL 46B-D3]
WWVEPASLTDASAALHEGGRGTLLRISGWVKVLLLVAVCGMAAACIIHACSAVIDALIDALRLLCQHAVLLPAFQSGMDQQLVVVVTVCLPSSESWS